MIMLGAPGAGKGSFARPIGNHYGIPFISTGDLMRTEIKNETVLGKYLKDLVNQGKLVGDEVVLEMVQNRIKSSDCDKGYILDGYPRRVSQAEALAEITELDLALNIALNEEVLVEKTMGRRVCDKCGKGYNIATIDCGEIQMDPLLPEKDGVCDECQGPLVQRDDDKEDIVRSRLQTYHDETHPLIEHYTNKGILMTFDVKKGMADAPELLKILDEKFA